VTVPAPSPIDPSAQRWLDRQERLGVLTAARHIGPKRALWLVERHGTSVLAVVDADPRRAFLAAPGIGHRAAREAAESWEAEYGIGAPQAVAA
jgi:Holliday junction resolvasome RuvABC DNA-binding subunit